MKIKLLPPYDKKWERGYLNTRPDGRKVLSLYNSPTDRSSVNYAKYLKETQLGRFLDSREFHVDHVDEDRTNDTHENLQVLKASINIGKGNRNRNSVV